MWRKKPWVEHGQAEGKSCIGTQASAPKHCKFYSAPLIFSPGLDAFCCFYSSPKSPASQISPSLLPSSQSLKAGNDGEDRQQKKPPHHFQCWNPFLAPSTVNLVLLLLSIPFSRTPQLQIDNLVLNLVLCNLSSLSLSAALTNLQLQPLATSILHWCQRIKKVEELVDPSPSKRFFNSQKSLDCGTLSNTFENVLITKYDPGRQYGKTPNDSERFWNSVKDPFWYLLIYSERHHKTLKQVCC